MQNRPGAETAKRAADSVRYWKKVRSHGKGGQETVCIVGAGIAGLTAANVLRAYGIHPIVLEGRDRIGGRIWTDHTWPHVSIDLGASWINGMKPNAMAALVEDLQIKTYETDYESKAALYGIEGSQLDPARLASHWRQAEAILDRLEQDQKNADVTVSVDSALNRALSETGLPPEDVREVRHCLHTMIEQEYAADASEMSFRYWNDYTEFQGEHVIVPGGYDQVAHKLAEGLEIRLGHTVEHIAYDGSRVRLETNQDTVEADAAIITVPLGVLQSGAVTFSPPLPERKRAAIRTLRMGVLDKLVLRFTACFWPEEPDWLEYAGPMLGAWAEFFNLYKYTGQPILVAFNYGAYARELEALPDEAIVVEALHVLRKMYGSAVAQPDTWLVTRWASDPFARGAYVFIPTGAAGDDIDTLAEPIGTRLFFAGEATDRAHYGTVQGAFLSGFRAAGLIAKPESAGLIASRNSPLYHLSPTCIDAARISPRNRIRGLFARKDKTCHAGCPRQIGRS